MIFWQIIFWIMFVSICAMIAYVAWTTIRLLIGK